MRGNSEIHANISLNRATGQPDSPKFVQLLIALREHFSGKSSAPKCHFIEVPVLGLQRLAFFTFISLAFYFEIFTEICEEWFLFLGAGQPSGLFKEWAQNGLA